MVNNLNIISVDIETTGLEVDKHVPLSIGAVKLSMSDEIVSNLNCFYTQLEWDSLVVDPKALRINGLDIVDPPGMGELHNRSLPAKVAIEEFFEWVGSTPWLDKSSVIAMGKNIGSFDLPMLKSVWSGPSGKLFWPFGYRSIDLNALFFVLADILNSSFEDVKRDITTKAWEKQRNLFDEMPLKPHHALADAWWNVFAYKECTKLFQLSGVPVA